MDWRIVHSARGWPSTFCWRCGHWTKLRHMIRNILLTNVVSIWFLIFLSDLDPHKCAGVIIAISTQTFTSRNVVHVVEVPAEFSGREPLSGYGGVSDVDVFLSLYVPTERRTMQERQRVGKLWAYTGRLLDAVPARCVPILCLDANAMSLLLLAMLTVNVKTGMGSSCENFANVIICVWLIHFSMLVLPIKVNRPGLCRKREAPSDSLSLRRDRLCCP